MWRNAGGLGRRGEVLRGIWAGKSVKEIGAELGISAKTVEYHRAKLFGVFGVHDPISLCRRALLLGVIRLEEKAESRKLKCGNQKRG